jgi:ribose transport system permease protein
MNKDTSRSKESVVKNATSQKKDYKKLVTEYAPYGIVILLAVLLTIGNANFLSPYNLQTIFDLSAALLMIALGEMTVVLLGCIDLSVGAIVSLVSVVFALTVGVVGYWAFIIALFVGFLAGVVNGIVFARFKIPSFIATLGTLGIFQSLAYVFANGAPVQIKYSFINILGIVSGNIFGISNLHLLAVFVLIVFVMFNKYTKTGRHILAVGNAEKAAWIAGVNTSKIKFIAMVISGFTAGIAGIFLASQLVSGTPTLGMPYQLQAVAATVVGGTALTGGVGSPMRTFAGVLAMALLSNGMNVVGVNIYAQQIVTGVVVVLAVWFTLDRSKISVIK